jgi:hypothetical protein
VVPSARKKLAGKSKDTAKNGNKVHIYKPLSKGGDQIPKAYSQVINAQNDSN